jgi:very-short-patch-repair endonuclease
MAGIIKSTVRQLRKGLTDSEAIVWEALRNRKLGGYKFFRQHPIEFDYYGKKRFFVADFYSAELKLVIEIDGKIHENQKEYDDYRTFIINQLGIQVVRVTNDEVHDVVRFKKWLEELIEEV